MSQVLAATTEAGTTFDCFGAECSVHVTGDGPLGDAGEAVEEAGRRLLAAHARITRTSGRMFEGQLVDLVAEALAAYPAFAVDCNGTVRVGGTEGASRLVHVPDPFGGEPLHAAVLMHGAAATARATGADAGLVQVTAWAPTALEAERRARAALRSRPEEAGTRLWHGGVVVSEDGATRVVRAG